MKVKIGKGMEVDVNVAALGFSGLADGVASHVVYIGLRNILMDAHANHTKEADGDDYIARSQATVEKKLQALYNGEVRSVGERETDPVARQMRLLAIGHARKALTANGRKMRDIKSEEITAEANRLLEKNEAAFRKVAEKMVKASADLKVEI